MEVDVRLVWRMEIMRRVVGEIPDRRHYRDGTTGVSFVPRKLDQRLMTYSYTFYFSYSALLRKKACVVVLMTACCWA